MQPGKAKPQTLQVSSLAAAGCAETTTWPAGKEPCRLMAHCPQGAPVVQAALLSFLFLASTWADGRACVRSWLGRALHMCLCKGCAGMAPCTAFLKCCSWQGLQQMQACSALNACCFGPALVWSLSGPPRAAAAMTTRAWSLKRLRRWWHMCATSSQKPTRATPLANSSWRRQTTLNTRCASCCGAKQEYHYLTCLCGVGLCCGALFAS